ncbi:enhancer of polycomb-like protein [Tanacetum coccineum]
MEENRWLGQKRKKIYRREEDEKRSYKKKTPREFASDWLTSSLRGGVVQPLYFNMDTQTYAELMDLFIESIGLDREFGFTSLEITAKTISPIPISIIFKKRTLYEVAIHDGHALYEIGLARDGQRHFKHVAFTEFGEKYSDMVGNLLGLRISRAVFRDAVTKIMVNPGNCKEWRHSAGIFAYMISEAGRFYWVNRILRVVMCMDLSITLDGRYEWMALIPHKWWLFSMWDRELKVKALSPPRKVQTNAFSNKGFDELTKGFEEPKDASLEDKRLLSNREQIEWRRQMEEEESGGIKVWEREKEEIERKKEEMALKTAQSQTKIESIRFLLKAYLKPAEGSTPSRFSTYKSYLDARSKHQR